MTVPSELKCFTKNMITWCNDVKTDLIFVYKTLSIRQLMQAKKASNKAEQILLLKEVERFL